MSTTGIHISLSAEPIAHLGDFAITNSMFTSLVVSLLLVAFVLVVNRSLKKTEHPSGLQNFAEWLVESLFNLVYGVTGDLKKARLFFPIIATFFIFILLNNWLGLVPGVGTIMTPLSETVEKATQLESGAASPEKPASITQIEEAKLLETDIKAEETVLAKIKTGQPQELVPLFRAGTADLNTTLALGIISVISIQLYGYHFSKLGYFTKFFNFSSPMMFYVGLLELISEVSKVISFAFRLFGNIFAGEVLLVVISSLTGLIGPLPFYGLEIFVGFIQALVFAMLSLVLMNMASLGHEEH